jgi:chemotaxis protein methyltransferase CheR
MIAKAKQGVYSKRSVEKLPRYMRERYFTQIGNSYKIDDSLRKAATFLQANIFDSSISEKLGHFDILFSRNMLIYFNIFDKRRAFETFYELLKPNAYLFLGHADASQIDKRVFHPLKATSHIYQKGIKL